MATKIESQYAILAEIFSDYTDDESFTDLLAYADLAFPLAFAVDKGIVGRTEAVDELVSEAFGLVLKLFEVSDLGFTSVEELASATNA